MKSVLLSFIFICTVSGVVRAQDYKFPSSDSSPADIMYFPLTVAKEKTPDLQPIIKIIYSRPKKRGREIFGVLEQYGKVWRTGANESTEIKFYRPVTIGGKKINPGTYSLFTIPEKDNWTMIINKKTDKWGAFTYDEKKDVVRVKVPVKKHEETIESFSITFAPITGGATLVLGWGHTVAEFPIYFK